MGIQIMRHYFPLSLGQRLRLIIPTTGESMRTHIPPYTVGRSINWYKLFWRTIWQYLSNISFDPAFPILEIHPHKITNDFPADKPNGKFSILFMLDSLALFGPVDHMVFLKTSPRVWIS